MSHRGELSKSRSIKIQSIVTEQQLKAYRDYINFITKDSPHVESIVEDLRSGLALIHYMENVTGKKVKKYNKNPKTDIQNRDNVEIALKFMKEQGVDVCLVTQDIFDHNEKQIMKLISTLVKKYHFRSLAS